MLQSAKVSLSKIKLFMTKFLGTPHSLSLSVRNSKGQYLLSLLIKTYATDSVLSNLSFHLGLRKGISGFTRYSSRENKQQYFCTMREITEQK